MLNNLKYCPFIACSKTDVLSTPNTAGNAKELTHHKTILFGRSYNHSQWL